MFKKYTTWEDLGDKKLADKLRDYQYLNSENGEYVDYDGNVHLTKKGAKIPFVVVHEGRHRDKVIKGDVLHNKRLNQLNDKLKKVAPTLAFLEGLNGGSDLKVMKHRLLLNTPTIMREGVVNAETRKILPKRFHKDTYTSDNTYAIGTLREIGDDLDKYQAGKFVRGLLIVKPGKIK